MDMKNIWPSFLEYAKELREVIRNDNDLMKKYYELGNEYDQEIEQLLSEAGKSDPYTYYYIRHYDPRLYRKRKSEYMKGLIKKKSQLNGRVECGPFKEDLIRSLLG